MTTFSPTRCLYHFLICQISNSFFFFLSDMVIWPLKPSQVKSWVGYVRWAECSWSPCLCPLSSPTSVVSIIRTNELTSEKPRRYCTSVWTNIDRSYFVDFTDYPMYFTYVPLRMCGSCPRAEASVTRTWGICLSKQTQNLWLSIIMFWWHFVHSYFGNVRIIFWNCFWVLITQTMFL